MQQLSPLHIESGMRKYEGVEKLLEVWFFAGEDSNITHSKDPDLRDLKRTQIEHLLELAQCEIVAEYHTRRQLSFVLSESSLFITDKRIILKTCGQTQLLRTLKPLIQYAIRLGFTKYVLYYSRRSFLFPELQAAPHRDFRTEVDLLDKFCETGDGYTFGRLNGDCWNFYYGQSTPEQLNEPPGQTLELMMRNLNPDKMELFYGRTSRSAEEATKRSGIADLFPHERVSAYLFTPCGYSANGLMNEDEYFTIHVTPEPEFSYVSFETNVAMLDYPSFITRVLAIFQPGSFICSFFSDWRSSTYTSHGAFERLLILHNYRRTNLHCACLAHGRKLTFAEYIRIEDHSPEVAVPREALEDSLTL